MEHIKNYLDAMFASLPQTPEAAAMKQGILENMEEKYQSLLREGKNEHEALGLVISQFGSIEELKKELPETSRALPTGEDEEYQTLKRDYLAFLPKSRLLCTLAILLFILALGLPGMYQNIASWELLSFFFFLLIAVGVGLLVYSFGRLGDYRRLLYIDKAESAPSHIEPFARTAPPAVRFRRRLYALIPILITLLFLILGLFFGLWHPGWMVFLLIPILIIVIEMLSIKEEEKR